MEICCISVGSAEWAEARKLRYVQFFEAHGLPVTVMDDEHEAEAVHLVMKDQGSVVGYGRFARLEEGLFQISQMVVRPDLQNKGIGKAVLSALLARAEAAEAVEVVLNARVGALAFYEAAGFVPCGEPFPSKSTGVPHVLMRMKMGRAKVAVSTNKRQA